MGDRPLAGISVAVTRATSQASTLAERLSSLGAEVVAVPTIAITDPADGGRALGEALASLDRYEWLVVTSANGADRVVSAAPDLATRLVNHATKVAAIGPGTTSALEHHGVAVDLQPPRFVAEGLLEVFPPPDPGPARVLLAQAAGGRPVLGAGLVGLGWDVVTVEAYRTITPEVPAPVVARAHQVDVVTFTSASTVEGYVASVGLDPHPRMVVCIGPVTAEAARSAGLRVTGVADPHTIDGVVDAVVAAVGAGG